MIRSYALLLLVLALFPLLLSGQSKWSYGLSLDGGLSGRDQVDDSYYPGAGTDFYYTESFGSSLSMGAGLWLSYQFCPWFALRTGLRYRNVGDTNAYHSETYTEATDQMATNYYSGTQLRVHQLQLPLLAEFSFALGQVRPFFQVGGNYQKEIGYQILEESFNPLTQKLMAGQNTVTQFNGTSRVQVEAAIGLHLNDRISLSLHRTWAGFQSLVWSRDNETVSSIPGNIIICGNFSQRITRSFFRQQLFLTLHYSL